MAGDTPKTIPEAIRQVASTLLGPVAFNDFADLVLAIRPSQSKNARQSIRTQLRYEGMRNGLMFIDADRKVVAPINLVVRGVRFRHVLEGEEIAAGALHLTPADWVYLPSYFPNEAQLRAIVWLDDSGQPPSVQLQKDKPPGVTASGGEEVRETGIGIAGWLADHAAAAGDAVLIAFDSYDPPRWRVAFERAADRDDAAVARRNAELVNELFASLESSHDEEIDLKETLLGAYLRFANPQGYPGDPWDVAVARDGRMESNGWHLTYADRDRLLLGEYDFGPVIEELGELELEEDDDFADQDVAHHAEGPPLPVEQAHAVYRFKVTPYRQATPWRRFEILGEQTLDELNRFLVGEFKHDWDHMGGFWRLIRRGQTKRFREVELGTIDPFGKGGGRRIAETELEAGDTVKWVFDFGDWNEYRLVLEEVTSGGEIAVDIGAYPQIVGQNKPRYKYCAQCEAEGRKTIATWICIECSYRQAADVMLCEACLDARHEDHHAEEWVY